MRQHLLGLVALLVVNTAFLVAIPPNASAQRVRVIADGTQVRLAPDPDGPVVATIDAGSILEQVVSDGPFAGVLFTTVGDHGPGPRRASFVQPQYAAADAMQSSGKRKIFVGLALVGTSWAALQFLPFLSVPDKDDYADNSSYQAALNRRSNAETGQRVLAGLGLAVSAWGIGQVVRASRMRADVELEARRAAAPGVELRYAIARERIGSGRKKLLWGIALAGASYATVNWVPYLAAPDPRDYNDDASYQVALDRRKNAERVRNGAMALSGALGAWGIYQWRAGSSEVAAIDAEVGARSAALELPLSAAHSDVAVGLFATPVGRRTAIGFQLVW